MRIAAFLVSVVFHPLLMLTYMLLIMLVVNPYMFGYSQVSEADNLILMVFLTSALIPLVAIFVMKGIGWVRSLEMEDKHERVGPYIVTGVLYLTLYLHLVKAKAFPPPLLVAALGTVIALFTSFIFNNFRKVSMHACAAGGLLLLTIILYRFYSTDHFMLPLPGREALLVPTTSLLYTVILLTGCICTARLIARKHTPGEVYVGFVLGFAGMWIASLVVL